MTPEQLQQESITLRDRLQRLESSQRRAYATATELRTRFMRLAMLIPLTEMAATNAVLQQIELLIAQLAPKGGAA